MTRPGESPLEVLARLLAIDVGPCEYDRGSPETLRAILDSLGEDAEILARAAHPHLERVPWETVATAGIVALLRWLDVDPLTVARAIDALLYGELAAARGEPRQ